MDITHNITKREELISLSAHYAECLKQHIIDSERPCIVNVLGIPYVGKSLIIDTMMMALLDELDHTKLYTQAPQIKQFLESEPSHALSKHLSIKGMVNNTPAQLSFDRTNISSYDVTDLLMNSFNKAAEGSGITKGVIFANSDINQSTLQITLDFSDTFRRAKIKNDWTGAIAKQRASKMWDRTVKISSPLPLEPFNGS